MKITLYLQDKIVTFKLPSEISGSYSFDEDPNEEAKLINIEARDNVWILYSTSYVNILNADGYIKDTPLNVNTFFILRRNNQNYLIYVSKIAFANMLTYIYQSNVNILLGHNSDSNVNVKYNYDYLKNMLVKITYKDNKLTLEKNDQALVYINKQALRGNLYYIKIGDSLEMYGVNIIFLNGLLLMNDVGSDLSVDETTSLISKYLFPVLSLPKNIEVKDRDLYSKNDYFSKAPRLRRIIETKDIKLSSPPKDNNNGELPLILVIGPMLTMGVMSGTMLLNTVTRIYSGQTTAADSWPQLVTSGAMLISMIVWPLVTQWYNRRQKKKHKQEVTEKYTAYLNTKREELREEAKLQKDILFENLITVNECLNIIKNRSLNFWDKRVDQSDFLVVRLGIGREKLDVKISYNEEDFTIDESDLQDQADKLVEEFKYIENVPVGYSFYENKITAVMGPYYKSVNFVHNVILQLITFYSYEDLKIVLLTNETNQSNWEYLRYLKHTFTNDMSFRFFATNLDAHKAIMEYLRMEFTNREANSKNNKETPDKPQYLIIVDDYDKIKRYDIIKDITESDDNLGFSLLIIENRMSKLPSKCNNFITVGDNSSGVLKNSYEQQEQIAFSDEINYNIDMLQITKVLSNIPIEFEDGISQLPDSISFLEMEKVGKVEQLNILNRWMINDSTQSLRAEIGVDQAGDLMYLDLHEKYHGPHGLIAGMTGSGKSEFIITYILSMAINYSPDDVSFILIDYKGGGLAFAFENQTSGTILPHLAGTITNLDKAEMDRTLVSINSELQRRQQLFNQARDNLNQSTIDIYKYQKFYKEGKLEEPIPHLFIICDEFAELKSQQPDFMDNLISVARIGRSLGVHLILATQKPSGVVNDQIWSNTKFRVCLKVQDESDSKEMLKRPEAASLRQVGRYYLQVGYNEYFALGQSAYCGAKYYPSEKIVKQVDKSVNFINDFGAFIKSIQAGTGIKKQAQGEQLQAVMNLIIKTAKDVNKKARRLWLPNIPEVILLDNLEKKYDWNKEESFSIIIGEYDAPEKQEQGLVKYNFLEDGNTVIYGNDGSEKEMLLNTIIYAATKNLDAKSLNLYFLDYGSESLVRWQNLPQVGGVVLAGEEEKYNNLFKLLKSELQKRKKLFVDYGGSYQNYLEKNEDKLPLIVVIINNYDSLYETNPDIYDELPDMLRDSMRYGITYIITANGSNSVPTKITNSISNIYAFKLKDVSDYSTVFGQRCKLMPRDIVGRGILSLDGLHEFQTASITDSSDLNDFIDSYIIEKEKNNTVKAKPIPTLPEVVSYDTIKEAITNLNQVPVGIVKNDLEIATYDFLSNLGNIITANRLAYTYNFVKSLVMIINSLPKTTLVVFDPLKQLNLDQNTYPNYYNENLEAVFDKISEYLQQLITDKSDSNLVLVIYGLNKFISRLSNSTKMTDFVNKAKTYEKVSIIVSDDYPKIKGYNFESWFTNVFSTNSGIYVGKGISNQALLHISNITRDMMKDYKNNMGYLVNEGTATLIKLLDFVSKEGDNDGE